MGADGKERRAWVWDFESNTDEGWRRDDRSTVDSTIGVSRLQAATRGLALTAPVSLSAAKKPAAIFLRAPFCAGDTAADLRNKRFTINYLLDGPSVPGSLGVQLWADTVLGPSTLGFEGAELNALTKLERTSGTGEQWSKYSDVRGLVFIVQLSGDSDWTGNLHLDDIVVEDL
jgi:hypothetical protein